MTLFCSRHVSGRTLFGLFHNLGISGEEVGYLFIHLFGAKIGITWCR
jgi:hypothetical protein